MGRLWYSRSYLLFQTDSVTQEIILKDVIKIKKGHSSIKIKVKKDDSTKTIFIGEFCDVTKKSFFEYLFNCWEYATGKLIRSSTSSNLESSNNEELRESVPGLKDPIVTQIFTDQSSLAPIPEKILTEPTGDPVINEVYNFSLKTAFAYLLSDSSTFSKEIHGKENDSELVFTTWALDPSKVFWTRNLDFKKKSSVVTCKVHQIQRARLKSPTELVFETTNIMSGIPFSDAFTVDSKWKFTEEKGKIRLRVWASVEFSKSVMFQGKIERNSIDGISEYLVHYAALLRSKFNKSGSSLAAHVGPLEAGTVVQPLKKKGMSLYIIVISAIVLIVSIFIALTLLQRKSVSLQEPVAVPSPTKGDLQVDKLQQIEVMLSALERSVNDLRLRIENCEKLAIKT